MKYNELNTAKNRSAKRVGRGISAGQGKTAGRGTKGQRSRSGSSKRPGFEGGQTPLMQRLPKLQGFKSFKTKAEVVYTGQLDELGTKIDTTILAKAGLISSPYVTVKLIVNGEVSKKHDVSLQKASNTAITAIQKAGGTFTNADRQPRPSIQKQDK